MDLKTYAENLISNHEIDLTDPEFYAEDQTKADLIGHIACQLVDKTSYDFKTRLHVFDLIVTVVTEAMRLLGESEYENLIDHDFFEETRPELRTLITRYAMVPQLNVFGTWLSEHLVKHCEEVVRYYQSGDYHTMVFLKVMIQTHRGILPGTFLESDGKCIHLSSNLEACHSFIKGKPLYQDYGLGVQPPTEEIIKRWVLPVKNFTVKVENSKIVTHIDFH